MTKRGSVSRSKVRAALEIVPENFVRRGENEKSGCLWCSLLVWSHDFPKFEHAFCRNTQAIRDREPDGHKVTTRRVTEAWDPCDILFVGEAPGADEDREGVPFIGRSGNMLRTAIEEYVTATKSVGITNVVRCRPPRNRDPGKTEIQACSPDLLREIEARKPKVVVCLGNHSLNFLTGQTGIMSFTGKVLACTRPEFPDLKVVACLHPAFILRFDHELERFIDAIQVANSVLAGTYEERQGVGSYYTLTEIEDVEALFAAFQEDGKPVAHDTETGHLKWWATDFPPLLCLSFSNEPGTGFTIPFDHPDSPWRIGGPKEHERPRLIAALQNHFESPIPKRAQNGKFDRNHIRMHLGVVPANTIDTMASHLTVDETKMSHGLKRLSYAYSGMGGYERDLELYKKSKDNKAADPERGGSYANIPGHILFVYAAMDADATVRVDLGIRADPEFERSERFSLLADGFFPRLSDTLADIEWNGAQINSEIVRTLDVRFRKTMEDLETEIQKLPQVIAYRRARVAAEKEDRFNPGSWQQLGVVLFDPAYFGEKPAKLTSGGMDRLRARYKAARAVWMQSEGKKIGREPSFGAIVAKAVEDREWDFFSTDAEVLQELEKRGNPLAAKIIEYREAQTLHGTFVVPLLTQLDPFGRIHGTFNLWGTVTGRLSSSDPNLQNIPNKDEGLIKHSYVSRFGAEGVLLQADYSQIELRIAASIFNESAMIQAYLDGEDVHTQTAVMISGLTPEEYEELSADERKQWRTRAKRINFGILYGGGPAALVKTLKKDGIFITFDEAEALIALYFEKRPELRRGIERLEAEVRRTGYLESFTGRYRRVPEVRSEDEQLVSRALRQSINFPVQSGASDMTLMALVLIHEEMQRRGLRSMIVLTVHDSILFDCHVDEFAEVAQLAKSIMENLQTLSDQVLPGIDWSWLKTPIVADFEAGTSWGTMVGFDPENPDYDALWEGMEKKAVEMVEKVAA